jgi:hypothetical protein
VWLHDLRRTAASAGASIGLSLETVGQLLGHAQVATTKRYAFLFDDAKREAAELLSARLATDLGRPGPVSLVERRRSGLAQLSNSSASERNVRARRGDGRAGSAAGAVALERGRRRAAHFAASAVDQRQLRLPVASE